MQKRLLLVAKQISKKVLNVSAAVVVAFSSLSLAAPMLFTGVAHAAGNNLYVNSSTGDDRRTCLDPANPCRTITKAVTNASDGDTIDVVAGTYNESPTINKSLTLLGAQANVAGASHGGNESTVNRFYITAGNVIVNGFDFNGTSTSGQVQVLSASTLSGVIIENNTFEGYSNVALPTNGAGNIVIQNNLFTAPSAAAEAIQIRTSNNAGDCSGTQVLDNVFTAATTNGAADINLSCTGSNSTNVTVSGNISQNASDPNGPNMVAFSGVTGGIVVSNNTASTSGSQVLFFGSVSGTASITSNTFTNGGGNAVSIHGGDDYIGVNDSSNTGTFTINNNTFTGNAYGVHVVSGAISGGGSVDASHNYWGTANLATIQSENDSGVTVAPFYVDSALTTLNTTAPANVYINSSYTTNSAGGHIFGYDAFTTIQAGVNAAAAGSTVNIASGTYNENISLANNVNLIGAGTSTIIQPLGAGPGISISASGSSSSTPLTISNLKVTGAIGGGNTGSGIAITAAASHININHVESSGNSGHGLAVNFGGGALNDLTLANDTFSNNTGDGFRIPSSMTSMDGLTISNSNFDNNAYGMEIYQPGSSDAGDVNNVTISNSTFNNDVNKGIYAERLDNASFNDITVSNSGTGGSSPVAVDLNLKFRSYSNISFTGGTISGGQTGLAIKGRNDTTTYAAHPANLSGVTISNLTVTDNTTGISIGNAVTGITIHNSSITSSSSKALDNYTDAATIDASQNWWGSANPNFGSLVSSNVTYKPFFTNSTMTTTSTPDDLTALSMSAGALSPAFSSSTTSYSTSVDNSVSSVTANYTASTGASVSVNGGSNLLPGNNTVTITVTSADGTASKTYTVTVYRTPAAQQTLPDSSGNATITNSTPQVVVTSTTQPINVTVASGTSSATIDYSSLKTSSTTAVVPQTTINTQNANVQIQSNTTITASDSSWNGVVNAPTVQTATSVSIPTPAGQSTIVGTVIDVGADNGISLTFDKAVRLLIPGQAGQLVGFVRGGNFTQITDVCSADSQDAGNALPAGGNCYINVGDDMAVWTKHFTQFVTYVKSNTYTVQPGDTMFSIATKLGLSLARLEALNPQAGHPAGNFSLILPGDVLKIGGAVVPASAVQNSNGSGSSPSEVLGESTNSAAPKTSSTSTTKPAVAAASAKSNAGKILGLKWYFWLIILAAVAVAGYGVYYVADTTSSN